MRQVSACLSVRGQHATGHLLLVLHVRTHAHADQSPLSRVFEARTPAGADRSTFPFLPPSARPRRHVHTKDADPRRGADGENEDGSGLTPTGS